MIKVERKLKEIKEVTYPKIMIAHTDNGSFLSVVLFTSSGKGIVLVASSGSAYRFGENRDDILMDLFKDYDGIIKIQNVD